MSLREKIIELLDKTDRQGIDEVMDWLKTNGFVYNAALPSLCHQYVNAGGNISAEQMDNLANLAQQVSVSGDAVVGMDFCQSYLQVFNEGVHFSFFASVAAMLISMTILRVSA